LAAGFAALLVVLGAVVVGFLVVVFEVIAISFSFPILMRPVQSGPLPRSVGPLAFTEQPVGYSYSGNYFHSLEGEEVSRLFPPWRLLR
jgi:hypothetical protein